MKKILFLLIFFNQSFTGQFTIQTNSFIGCSAQPCSSITDKFNSELYRKFSAKIPVIFTCDGQDISPQLSWTNIPNGTHSFVLIMDDPDAQHVVNKTFIHWFVMNIPSTINSFPENVILGQGQYINIIQLRNDFGNSRYGGPCPPKGDFPHIYRFSLFALNTPTITLNNALTAEQFELQFKNNILNCTRLLGVYQRQ
jgi:Raf kinase inhibitor-like YbhB/YbcL family protein